MLLTVSIWLAVYTQAAVSAAHLKERAANATYLFFFKILTC